MLMLAIIGFAAIQSALFGVARIVMTSKSYNEFIYSIINRVYLISSIVILFSFMFNEGAFLLVYFGITYFTTLFLVDYEETYEWRQKFYNDSE
jgi:hypothetical protein